jgi:hypothetical protein
VDVTDQHVVLVEDFPGLSDELAPFVDVAGEAVAAAAAVMANNDFLERGTRGLGEMKKEEGARVEDANAGSGSRGGTGWKRG